MYTHKHIAEGNLITNIYMYVYKYMSRYRHGYITSDTDSAHRVSFVYHTGFSYPNPWPILPLGSFVTMKKSVLTKLGFNT